MDGIHWFRDDKEFEDLLKCFIKNELTEGDIERLNIKMTGQNSFTLPKLIEGDTCYVCPTNKERKSITASIFREHLQTTHPDVTSAALPPGHTIIIEAVIYLTDKANNKVNLTSLH